VDYQSISISADELNLLLASVQSARLDAPSPSIANAGRSDGGVTIIRAIDADGAPTEFVMPTLYSGYATQLGTAPESLHALDAMLTQLTQRAAEEGKAWTGHLPFVPIAPFVGG
jgi:hypothetical protein